MMIEALESRIFLSADAQVSSSAKELTLTLPKEAGEHADSNATEVTVNGNDPAIVTGKIVELHGGHSTPVPESDAWVSVSKKNHHHYLLVNVSFKGLDPKAHYGVIIKVGDKDVRERLVPLEVKSAK